MITICKKRPSYSSFTDSVAMFGATFVFFEMFVDGKVSYCAYFTPKWCLQYACHYSYYVDMTEATVLFVRFHPA